MAGVDFNTKAVTYEQTGLVQKVAGDRLLELLSIPPEADVLDLGCGSGGITNRIAAATSGRVLGIDLSEGMIREARSRYKHMCNLDFVIMDVVNLDYINKFDRIFCNSAFQWFSQPEKILAGCFAALKPEGVMGIQATATANYCPQFLYVMQKVARDQRTGKVFQYFKSPWLFLDGAEDYSNLFKAAGFEIDHCRLINEKTMYTVDEVYGIFKLGAENGYLNKAYYNVPIDLEYVEDCRTIIKTAFEELTNAMGLVELVFTRVYVLVKKPAH